MSSVAGGQGGGGVKTQAVLIAVAVVVLVPVGDVHSQRPFLGESTKEQLGLQAGLKECVSSP